MGARKAGATGGRSLEYTEKSMEVKLPPLHKFLPPHRRSLQSLPPSARPFPSLSSVDIKISVLEAGAGRYKENEDWSGGTADSHDTPNNYRTPRTSAVSSVPSRLSL